MDTQALLDFWQASEKAVQSTIGSGVVVFIEGAINWQWKLLLLTLSVYVADLANLVSYTYLYSEQLVFLVEGLYKPYSNK